MKQCYSNIECLEVQGLECDERQLCDCVDDQNKYVLNSISAMDDWK